MEYYEHILSLVLSYRSLSFIVTKLRQLAFNFYSLEAEMAIGKYTSFF
jgi:hypothetical protein